VTSQAQPEWLLVSDIDDTLTGDRTALVGLLAAIREVTPRIRVVLNSSRPSGSVDLTLRDYFPPDFVPDGIVTGLGSEIRLDAAFLPEWSDRFRHWPRQEIVDIVAGLGHRPHPDEFQTSGKASFAVADRQAVDELLEVLAARGLPFQAIYSGASDLDLIAPEAGKDEALIFLSRHFEVPCERVIAAGDSGNDLAMFEAAGRAIAVGNARRELLESAPRYKTYFARAAHAGGVHEGLRALGVLPA
jgi:sucrose-6F-phosphate phosphohydrolase